jgi:hypothetical protein
MLRDCRRGFRQHKFDTARRFSITREFGCDGSYLLVTRQHQEGRRASIGLHAGEVEARLVLREFGRAMGANVLLPSN